MVIPSGKIGKDSTSHRLYRKRGDRVFRYPQTLASIKQISLRQGKNFFQLNDVKRDYSLLMAWTLLQQRPPCALYRRTFRLNKGVSFSFHFKDRVGCLLKEGNILLLSVN